MSESEQVAVTSEGCSYTPGREKYLWRCSTHGRFTKEQADELLLCPFCWKHLTHDDGMVALP